MRNKPASGRRADPGDAADVDDRAPPPVGEGGPGEGPRAMQRPGDVRRQDALRLGSVRVDERHKGEARRVVDEDVGRAEPLGRRGDDPIAIGRLGDVRRDRQDLRPGNLRNRRRRMFEQSLRRPATATLAPSRAKARATAKPMPRRRR